MSRARNIKPGFFDNERLAECSPEARLLFIGLWTIADREGRLEDRPRRIKAQLFPYDNWDAEKLIQSLADCLFIVRYQVDGECYIWIPTFTKHQKPHVNEKESVIPPYVEACTTKVASTCDQGTKHLALNDERGMMKDEPTGGGEVGPQTRPEMIPIPVNLETPEFKQAWFNRWIPYLTRISGGRIPDHATLASQLTMCARAGPLSSIESIDHSIRAGWKMLKEPGTNKAKSSDRLKKALGR